MIIAIDIGNTNTGIAILDVETRQCLVSTKIKITRTETVKTGLRGCYEKRMTKALRTLLSDTRAQGYKDTRKIPPNTEVVICSVVPKATAIAARSVKKVFKTAPKIVGKDIIVPIKNRYDEPEQVGQDRLVCAYAAVELYGAPAVIVDLGTAMTFDVVSSKREYLGGIIAPGIRLSAETLFQQTALLPKVSIHKPKQLIGKNTEESILSGMFYGYGEMIKGIVDLLVKQLKTQPKIIITGGFSDVMKNYVPEYPCIVDKELIFKGMVRLVQGGER